MNQHPWELLPVYSLTYDLWKEIIDDVAHEHLTLFMAMHQAEEEIEISKALIEDLKNKRDLIIADDPWHLQLQIDFIDDKIGGFRINIAAEEELKVFELIKAKSAADHGFSLEEIQGFEIEHGLDMDEEIFEAIADSYEIQAELSENEVLFELVVFDSQDIDDSQMCNLVWQEEDSAN
jgi:hypothetical protein